MVFQTESDLVRQYRKMANYRIEEDGSSVTNICAIYFSSNDIYYPNTTEAFSERIVDGDHFEWYRTRVSGAAKHIFLRDIYKQWYLQGINENINSPESLYEFLARETSGYTVTAVGSSAGGYAAVLYGTRLHAQSILCFNGQFELNSLLHSSRPEVNPLVFKFANSVLRDLYDLGPRIGPRDNIFYFYSKSSHQDGVQYRHAALSGVRGIAFSTSHHGIPFLKSALPATLAMDRTRLQSLIGRSFNPVLYSLRYAGPRSTFRYLAELLARLIRAKL